MFRSRTASSGCVKENGSPSQGENLLRDAVNNNSYRESNSERADFRSRLSNLAASVDTQVNYRAYSVFV